MSEHSKQPATPQIGQMINAIMLFCMALLALLLVLPYLLIIRPLQALVLRLWITFSWHPRGIYGVLAYSSEPISQEYIEDVMAPRLQDHLFLVNVSYRRMWGALFGTPADIVDHWLGINRATTKLRRRVPAAVLFLPGMRPTIFPLGESFSYYRDGVDSPLKRQEAELYALLGLIG
jgi:hypothetical protein